MGPIRQEPGTDTPVESVADRAERRSVDGSAVSPPPAPRLSRRDTGESTRERAARRSVGDRPPGPASRPGTPVARAGQSEPASASEGAVLPGGTPSWAEAEPAAARPVKGTGEALAAARRSVGALMVLSVALLAGSFALGRWTAREPAVDVQVPVIRGEDVSTATNVLQELGLRVVLTPAVFDAEVPRNAVIASNPPAGVTLRSGSVATITYSNGPEPVVVPPLGGQPEDAARDALSQVGLTAGLRVEEVSSQVPAGSVVRLEPPFGSSVSPGTSVTLVISGGDPPVVLARVIGLSEAEARDQLLAEGLQVETEQQADPDAPAGRVIDQSPAPGTVANPGTAVVLTVSSG